MKNCAGCGAGVVDVGIIDPTGKRDTVKTTITRKSDDLWYVEYTALIPGLHSINVTFGGKPIPKSPYAVGVSGGYNCGVNFICINDIIAL